MLLKLFLIFLKIGVTTFGGGYAMISNVQEEIVEKRKWLTQEEFIQLIAVAEATPGPIAINMATYVGYKKSKLLGAILATLGVVLPSLLIIFGLSFVFNYFIGATWFNYLFMGIKAGVAFLIIRSGVKLLKNASFKIWQKGLFILILLSAITIDLFSINFSAVFVILIGGFVGYLITVLTSRKIKEIK